MFLTFSAFNTLHQFWIHPRTTAGLCPLEWVLNTPSHHRVHHARDSGCIDRHHGDPLIVWDRIFGTFARRKEPAYGITRPLAAETCCGPTCTLGGVGGQGAPQPALARPAQGLPGSPHLAARRARRLPAAARGTPRRLSQVDRRRARFESLRPEIGRFRVAALPIFSALEPDSPPRV